MVRTAMKPVGKLTAPEKRLMNRARKREGADRKDFDKDYTRGTKFFFVKEQDKILSFGALMPVKIEYKGENYDIMGICNIFSVEKGKGYGRMLIKKMIEHLKSTGKTGIGFTGEAEFFKKAGLKTKKEFGRRFALRNPRTGEVRFEAEDDIGDGVYFEGKDKLITKMIKTKGTAYYWLPRLKEPHF